MNKLKNNKVIAGLIVFFIFACFALAFPIVSSLLLWGMTLIIIFIAFLIYLAIIKIGYRMVMVMFGRRKYQSLADIFKII